MSNDPAAAAAEAEAVLVRQPGYPVAMLLLGVASRLLARHDRSLEVLGKLARAQPSSGIAQFEFALSLAAAGQENAALQGLRRAVEVNPQLAAAWLELAGRFHALGQPLDGRAAYDNYIAAASRDPALAKTAEGSDTYEQRLWQRVTSRPDDLAALKILADLEFSLGRNADARNLYARCVAIAPGFLTARYGLALSLHRLGDFPAARAEADHLLGLDPDNPWYLVLRGAILVRTGEMEAALAAYSRAVELNGGGGRPLVSYANALRAAGQTALAIDAYKRSIAEQPGLGEAWWGLANLKTYRFSVDETGRMESLLGSPGLSDHDRLHLAFAVAKSFEDAGEYERAFSRYALGNSLRRSAIDHDPAQTSSFVKACRRLFTREYVDAANGLGCERPDPIFIVGMPRAGSTLLEQILASHSQVEGTMELPNVMGIARDLGTEGEGRWPESFCGVMQRLEGGRWTELGERYLAETALQRKTPAPRFVDKQPNNFLHAGLILLMLPNARIIDARRHPMSCCFSNFKQHFAHGQKFSYDLADLARYYRDYVELMAHFDAVFPGCILRVHYEDMVSDTEAQVRRMLDYCELPFEEACLRFYENDRSVRTASSEQVRQPIYRQGVEQWKHFEPWLGPLKEGLGEVLERYPAVPEFPPA